MMCTICNELLGLSDDNRFYISNKFGMKNAVLAKNQYFTLVPSVGALANGHCLIVPNIHCNSILKFAKEENLIFNFNDFLINSFKKLITEEDFDLICFEHGSFSTEADYSLCSTSHAHLHVIPIERGKINRILAKVDGPYNEDIVDLAGLVRGALKFNDYITIFTFCNGKVNNCKIINAFGEPSQYIRKLIGDELQNKNWNWKISRSSHFTDETIERYFLESKATS